MIIINKKKLLTLKCTLLRQGKPIITKPPTPLDLYEIIYKKHGEPSMQNDCKI